MSTTDDTTTPDEPTECIAPGCAQPGTVVRRVDEGYRLACEAHGEGGLDLEDIDFREFYESHPESVALLRAVSNVRYLWLNELDLETDIDDRKRRTASLVVREEDGEIVGESERYGFPAVWGLVAVDTPEDTDDWRRDDPPEMPEWAEWVHCDPPMEHHVEGIRCLDCGVTREFHDPKMPRAMARREPLDSTFWAHRPECPQATDDDRQTWAEKHLAGIVNERPDPGVMALGALWAECDWLHRLEEHDYHGYIEPALHARWPRLERELKQRLDPRWPACPECGSTEWELSPERYPERCENCYESASEAVAAAHRHQRRRIWGFEGHLERGRG